jgi:hypothetical protein
LKAELKPIKKDKAMKVKTNVKAGQCGGHGHGE